MQSENQPQGAGSGEPAEAGEKSGCPDCDAHGLGACQVMAPTARPAPAEGLPVAEHHVTSVFPVEDGEPSGTASLRGAARLEESGYTIQDVELARKAATQIGFAVEVSNGWSESQFMSVIRRILRAVTKGDGR